MSAEQSAASDEEIRSTALAAMEIFAEDGEDEAVRVAAERAIERAQEVGDDE